MKMKQILAAALLFCTTGAWAQTNYVAGWDGGNDTSSPTNFGWTSSENRTMNARNAGSGIRMKTDYSGYKLEDGTEYKYSATSDPSSVIFWIRYNTAGESFTYTFTGLTAGLEYKFSCLVGWHNNDSNPTFTIKIKGGDNELGSVSKAITVKQTLYAISLNFTVPADDTSESYVVEFTCNKVGDCMEALSALSLTERDYPTEFQEALQKAQDAVADEAYANVTGAEKSELNNAISTYSSTSDYKSAITVLEEATAAFIAAKASYDAVLAANALAEEYNIAKVIVTAESTAATIDAAVAEIYATVNIIKQDKNVALFNEVETNYPYDIALGSWTTTGKVKINKGQHWNGDAEATYNEPDSWSDNSASATWTQDITLPAGSYALKIAGRRSGSSDLTATVKLGEDILASANDFPAQDKGRGIDVDGKATFADDATYANENAGRGFEWRLLPFTLSEDGTVTIAVEYSTNKNQQWASFCDYVIKSKSPKEKAELMNAIVTAQSIDLTANVGTAPFQKNFTDDGTLANAISEAQSICEKGSATPAEFQQAITDLNDAVSTVTESFNNAPLNVPADGQLFNLILAYEGYQYNNKAVTYLANDRSDAGSYNIKYKEEANRNLAQAFTFTKVEDNKYKLSQIDADGSVRYVCTGVVYGGNASQLRTTTEEEQALLINVIATNKAGIYNLYNTEADNYIGSQDAGFFTVNSHIDFKIQETEKPSITINTTEAGWGTVMLPFAVAELPTGVKAYTVEDVESDGSTLTLAKADALEANKPYVIEGAWQATLTGDAQGTTLISTNGLLTGTYAAAEAPVGSYVLQNLAAGVGFYKVAEGKQPTVEANHAYLTVPEKKEEESVKAFILSETTGVQSVKVAAQNGDIFNLAGQRVSKAQKGIFIQNGKKMVVK